MKRVLLWILAVLVFLLGAASLAGAGWLLAVFGTTGELRTDVGSIACPDGRAIVLDLAGVTTTIPDAARLGQTTLDVSSVKPVFVGASERTNVDPLLVGQSYCVANRNGAEWGVVAIPGADATAFGASRWRTVSVGTSVPVPIGVNDPITVLVVNDDGTKGVTATLAVAFRSQNVQPTVITAGVIGAVLVIAAIGLAVWALLLGRRRRRENVAPIASPTAPPEVFEDLLSSAPKGKHAGLPKEETPPA